MKQDEMTSTDFLKIMRNVLNRNVLGLRASEHITQQEIANLLDCSRQRIARIEAGESEYTVGELALLGRLFGKDLFEMIELSGMDFAALSSAYSAKAIRQAFGQRIDCEKPEGSCLWGGAGYVSQWIQRVGPVFSPDQTMVALVVANGDGQTGTVQPGQQVCVWDCRTGRLLASFEVVGEVTAIAFGPDGRTLAFFRRDNEHVEIWNLVTHNQIASVKPRQSVAGEIQSGAWPVVTHILWTPDGRSVVTYDEVNGCVQYWSTQDWRLERSLPLWLLMSDDDVNDDLDEDQPASQDTEERGHFLCINKMQFHLGFGCLAFTLGEIGQIASSGEIWGLVFKDGEAWVKKMQGVPRGRLDFAFSVDGPEDPAFLSAGAGEDGYYCVMALEEDNGFTHEAVLVKSTGLPGDVVQVVFASPVDPVILIAWKEHERVVGWEIRNLATSQGVALLDAPIGQSVSDGNGPKLSPDGCLVVYPTEDGLRLQALNPVDMGKPLIHMHPLANRLLEFCEGEF